MGAFRSRSHWHYAEVRPIPLHLFNAILDGANEVITTDCSGLATCCYFRAGAPDPNGQGYDIRQTMFTGSMLNHLPSIPLNRAQGGDLAVFGTFPGKHVVVLLESGEDPMCVSHGGPGDPKLAPLSTFRSIGPLTVLRGVPRMKRRVFNKAKWRVVGDGGKVVGLVYTTRFLWWCRHRQLAKNQRETLAFHRIHH